VLFLNEKSLFLSQADVRMKMLVFCEIGFLKIEVNILDPEDFEHLKLMPSLGVWQMPIECKRFLAPFKTLSFLIK